jgi:outer membrane protein assembly factor BamB
MASQMRQITETSRKLAFVQVSGDLTDNATDAEFSSTRPAPPPPPAVSGDTVYVGSNNGHLYGLDRATGAERWKFEIGSWVASGPAISGNALLAGAWDGNLYAFTED